MEKYNYHQIILQMEISILDCLSKLENGYGYRKKTISKQTGIPLDVLTVLLKRLKDSGKIELMQIFSEVNGMANGRGYSLIGQKY